MVTPEEVQKSVAAAKAERDRLLQEEVERAEKEIDWELLKGTVEVILSSDYTEDAIHRAAELYREHWEVKLLQGGGRGTNYVLRFTPKPKQEMSPLPLCGCSKRHVLGVCWE